MRRWRLGGARETVRCVVGLGVILLLSMSATAQVLDISEVEPDLVIPALSAGPPAAGKRVKQVIPSKTGTGAHHVICLPTDWKPGGSYPVIVEYAGNGPYKNRFGDESTGRVEGSKMGHGISGGKGFIWACLPYLNGTGTANVTRWWGDQPEFDPQPTIDYACEAVPWICEQYGGDPGRVVLCGFSRGAIACNFIGLHDDRIAKLWAAFIPFSHYDGVKTGWPYPGKDRESALARLKRLGSRPQFICSEGAGSEATRTYVEGTGVAGNFTFRGSGFRNHNDAWLLRPSAARKELRAWLAQIVEKP